MKRAIRVLLWFCAAVYVVRGLGWLWELLARETDDPRTWILEAAYYLSRFGVLIAMAQIHKAVCESAASERQGGKDAEG